MKDDNSIESYFTDSDYDEVLSDSFWGTDGLYLAQLDQIENVMNFDDAEEMYEFAIHGVDLTGVNPYHL